MVTSLARLIDGRDDPHHRSVDAGLRSQRGMHELALLYRRMGGSAPLRRGAAGDRGAAAGLCFRLPAPRGKEWLYVPLGCRLGQKRITQLTQAKTATAITNRVTATTGVLRLIVL